MSEESDARAMFESGQSCNIERWYPKLKEISIPAYGFELTMAQMKAMREEIWSPGENSEERWKTHLIYVQTSIEKLFDEHRDLKKGAFVRLGSRSPKDSFYPFSRQLREKKEGNAKAVRTYKVRTEGEAMSMLLDSERVFDDLARSDHFHTTQWVFLRPWIDIKYEFRTFIVKGELKGISQYVGHDMQNEWQPFDKKMTIEMVRDIFHWVRDFCNAKLIPLLPGPHVSLIADFVMMKKTYDIMLLEINPYWSFSMGTDPCLFDWKADGFEALQYRFLDKDLNTILWRQDGWLSIPRQSAKQVDEVTAE